MRGSRTKKLREKLERSFRVDIASVILSTQFYTYNIMLRLIMITKHKIPDRVITVLHPWSMFLNPVCGL